MKPVVVVGGGIAGLATAYELARQQIPFVVLERSTRLVRALSAMLGWSDGFRPVGWHGSRQM